MEHYSPSLNVIRRKSHIIKIHYENLPERKENCTLTRIQCMLASFNTEFSPKKKEKDFYLGFILVLADISGKNSSF